MSLPISIRRSFGSPAVLFATCALIAGVFVAAAPEGAQAQMHGRGIGAGMHGHGHNGTGHDEVNMPGLKGKNATETESSELAILFQNFRTITREVANLPNGIRTVTHSSDKAVMDILVSHIVGMIGRVETGDDPGIFIQSPTLDIFFERGDRIDTSIEVTDEGVIVVQTSEDPEIVEALQIHAAEVTAMADQGMRAVHEMMMSRAAN